MNLVARVQGILTDPTAEWKAIEQEPADTGALLKSYVAILAAIPAVCGLIGSLLVGAQIVPAFLFAAVSYALTFAGVYLIAIVIEILAPVFKGQKNFANALRLAVYFPTAYWLAGAFFVIPILSILFVLGLYSLYLLWVGLTILMRAPEDKLVGYAASVGVGAIIVVAIIWTVAARVAGVSLWV
jgi:hypothetical protein